MFVTISLGGFVADQMWYNLESAQYLWNATNLIWRVLASSIPELP